MTKRKIFDIIPPQEKISAEIPEEILPSDSEKEFNLPADTPGGSDGQQQEPVFTVSHKRGGGRSVIYLFLAIIAVGGLACYLGLAKAEIEVWPKVEVVKFSGEITIDTGSSAISLNGRAIPGKIFVAEKTLSQEYTATGKAVKEGRAEGIIRVYNAHSASPQTLLVKTRFIAASGELFHSVGQVTIPGATYEKGKLARSYLDVKVIAAEAGGEYNIGPSRFSIPGFLGTTKYMGFYGESFSPMAGGWEGDVIKVSEEDLLRAKENLVEGLKQESKVSLASIMGSVFIPINETLEQEIIASSTSAHVGDVVDSFTCQAILSSKVLAFRLEDLFSLGQEYVFSQVSEDRLINRDKVEYQWKIEDVNPGEGKATLSLNFSAPVYQEIDRESLKLTLEGKSTKEVYALFQSKPEVARAKVSFWPFWVRKVPSDSDKVMIELKLDDIQ